MPPSISRAIRRCGSRCRRCCASKKGGAEQIAGELEAYNPLIPQGSELIATVMIEIEDADRRGRELRRLGHIEDSAFLEIGKDRIVGTPTDYEDRTTRTARPRRCTGCASRCTGCASCSPRRRSLRSAAAPEPVVLGFTHPNYGHMAVMPAATREALAKDFA